MPAARLRVPAALHLPAVLRGAARWLRATVRRLRPESVRARATVAACAVVATALAAAGFALLALLHADLRRTAEDGARQQAEAIAGLAAQGRLTPLLPTGHGTDFLQVVDAGGRVIAASQNVAGRLPVVIGSQEGARTDRAPWKDDPLGDEHRQRVAIVIADTPTGRVTILAGASLRYADTAEDTATAALAVGCPLLLLTVALVTWRVTGRALRPVEAIRAEVAAIGDRELHRRVPQPRGDDEISDLAATMNAMLGRLEAAGQRQREFIADASHELRSPLTVLRTQLEVARAHPDPAVRAELVDGALEDTGRLQDLAADLLLLARLDASAGALAGGDPDPGVDLTELVRAAVRPRTADRLPVRLDLADGVRVPGHPLWMTRLLTNLLDNAQRHADREVRVVLRADRDASEAVLEVHDDGPGIAPADRDRVFERFARLDDARSRDHGGAGLGLPIARDIAHHHGGTLTAADAPAGALLRARLPLAR